MSLFTTMAASEWKGFISFLGNQKRVLNHIYAADANVSLKANISSCIIQRAGLS